MCEWQSQHSVEIAIIVVLMNVHVCFVKMFMDKLCVHVYFPAWFCFSKQARFLFLLGLG